MQTKELVTRQELRQMGLDVSNTTFGRWEKAKLLTPIKAGRLRSSKVRYRFEEARRNLLEPPEK